MYLLIDHETRVWFEKKRADKESVRRTGVAKKSSIPQDNVTDSTVLLTIKQLKILMAHFKKNFTLSADEEVEVATRAGLQLNQLRRWFELQQLRMKTNTMNKILQNLSSIWHPTQLVELEKTFRISNFLHPAEKARLCRVWDVNPTEVLVWFTRRRLYELYKIHGTNLAVSKEQEVTRDILEATDLSTVVCRIESEKQLHFPMLILPRCCTSKDDLSENPGPESETTGNSKSESFDSDESIHQLYRENTSGKLPSFVVQNTLFEEFKMSQQLSTERIRILQNRLQIPAYRIKAFFAKWSALLRGATKTSVLKQLTSQPFAFVSEVSAEYHKNRFISVMKNQTLSLQLGTSRRAIDNWFINARLYELITGNQYIPDTVRETSKKTSMSHLSETSTSSKPSYPDSKTSAMSQLNRKLKKPLSMSVQKHLMEEICQNSIVTEARLKTFARKFRIGKDSLRSWFKNYAPASYEINKEASEAELRTTDPVTAGCNNIEMESNVGVRRSVRQEAKRSASKSFLNASDELIILDEESDENSDLDTFVGASISNSCEISCSSDTAGKRKCDESFCLTSTLAETPPRPKEVPFSGIDNVYSSKQDIGFVPASKVVEEDSDADGIQMKSDQESSPSLTKNSQASSLKIFEAETEKKCTIQSFQKKFDFSTLQHQILLMMFQKREFLSATQTRQLASDLNAPVKRIEEWFENRRSLKTKSMEMESMVQSERDERIESAGCEELVNSTREEATKLVNSLKMVNSEREESMDAQKMENSQQETDLCTPFSEFQLFLLEREFAKSSKLPKSRLDRVCKNLRTSRKLVRQWFKNRNCEEN
ncbi:hypothetical protein V9T40_010848 [Parthenolecanium corni]|uniref:Homeobox domain-containing protein n=1 Tax=Parthenolecanium corni TaxID=536013 RepID=A0AAN9XXV6_9HEMI